ILVLPTTHPLSPHTGREPIETLQPRQKIRLCPGAGPNCGFNANAIASASALRQNPSTDGDVTVFTEDHEIIARFLRRETSAVKVIEDWIARAASSFRQRLGSHWEDLLQEVSLEITRLLERGSFRGESKLKTYIWRVTCHACLKQLRAQSR